MKLRLVACLAASALLSVTQALATPTLIPFLSVDVAGYNAGGGQSRGPLEPGFLEWELAEGLLLDPSIDWSGGGAAGISKTFPSSQGDLTVTLTGVGASNGARNRGANAGGFDELVQDFVFAQRDFGGGLGQNWIKLEIAGLVPNRNYELTWFARESAFNGAAQTGQMPTASYQAFSDLNELGGLDGPGAWMDANIGVGATYNAIQENGGSYGNPIPTKLRSPVSGPDSASSSNPYHHSASFFTTTDSNGVLTAYSWADGNSFAPNVQGATLINGFQLGNSVPEPNTLILLAIALSGSLVMRRKCD